MSASLDARRRGSFTNVGGSPRAPPGGAPLAPPDLAETRAFRGEASDQEMKRNWKERREKECRGSLKRKQRISVLQHLN